MGEGNSEDSNNFEMVILDENALDKSLKVPEENLYGVKPVFYGIILYEYFKQSNIKFTIFLIKMQNRVQYFSSYNC